MFRLNCIATNNKIILKMDCLENPLSKDVPSIPATIIKDILNDLQNKFDVYEITPPVENRYNFIEEPEKKIKFVRNAINFGGKKEKYFYKIDDTYLRRHEIPKEDWIDVYEKEKQHLRMSFDLLAEIGSMMFDAEFHAVAVVNGSDFFEKIQNLTYKQFRESLSELIEVEISNDEDSCWIIKCDEIIKNEIVSIIEPYKKLYE